MARKRIDGYANLTVDATANILSVSPNTVRNMISRGEIKAIKVGRAVRIPVPELEDLGAYVPTSVKADA